MKAVNHLRKKLCLTRLTGFWKCLWVWCLLLFVCSHIYFPLCVYYGNEKRKIVNWEFFLKVFQLKNNHIAPSHKIYIKNKNKSKTMWWRTCLNSGKLRWNVSNISAVMQLNIIAHIAQLHKKKKSYLAISTETEVLLIIAS